LSKNKPSFEKYTQSLIGRITIVLFGFYALLIAATLLGIISTFSELMNILLTYSIAIFAAIQGLSMVRQEELQKTRNKIEDLRNELEKAYGKLYSIFKREYFQPDEWSNESKQIKEIMMTYPFIFPKGTFELWQALQRKADDFGDSISKIADESVSKKFKDEYFSKLNEFKNRIIEEYNHKVKEYQDLVGKEQEEDTGEKPSSETTQNTA